jgi:hypothetical protein
MILTTISCTHTQFPCLLSSYEAVVKHSSHVNVTSSLKCGLTVNEQNKEIGGLQVQHVITVGVPYYSSATRSGTLSVKIILIRKQCGILSKLHVL